MNAGDSPSSAFGIAGGGIIGLSIAWRLAQAGYSVEVFDQGSAGQEASWAGAGMLAPGGEIESASPLASLAIESRQLYRSFIDQLEGESGLSIDLQESGALELAYSAEDWQALNRKAGIQRSLAIHSRALQPKQVLTFWPRVRVEQLAGARFYPNDATVNPREVIAALKVALVRRRVQLHERCPVKRVSVADEYVELGCDHGTHRFSAVVVAMGAWSCGLSITGVPALPLSEPVKGHLIGYHQPEQTCSTIIRYRHTYLLQRANGLLVVGASVENAGFDRAINPTIAADLARQASLVFPHLAETTPAEVWTGFRPGAASLQIGPWHSPRLQLAYGHYRNGILLAPVTAQKIADELRALER